VSIIYHFATKVNTFFTKNVLLSPIVTGINHFFELDIVTMFFHKDFFLLFADILDRNDILAGALVDSKRQAINRGVFLFFTHL
jgi:hypothetical protein